MKKLAVVAQYVKNIFRQTIRHNPERLPTLQLQLICKLARLFVVCHVLKSGSLNLSSQRALCFPDNNASYQWSASPAAVLVHLKNLLCLSSVSWPAAALTSDPSLFVCGGFSSVVSKRTQWQMLWGLRVTEKCSYHWKKTATFFLST